MARKWTDEERQAHRERMAPKLAEARAKQRAKLAAKKAAAVGVVQQPIQEPIKESLPAPMIGFEMPAALTKPIDQYRIAGPVVELTQDEWDRKVKSSYNPFDEASEPYRLANPDKHFAYQSPRVQRVQGARSMTPVLDKDGHYVEIAGQRLYWEPLRQRQAKDKLITNRAAQQAAAPEESYREIQERIQHSSARNLGIGVLKDNEIVRGGGVLHDPETGRPMTRTDPQTGKQEPVWTEGAAQIGIKTVVGAG